MSTNAATEICFMDAIELAAMIRNRKLSAREVMNAFLSQIERVNPKVNAICTLIEEEAALRAADKADVRLAKAQHCGPLHGLPHLVKDLVLTAGVRTTFGSRIYKDFVPDIDSLIVERIKTAGAIIIGKTNTPEFGAGSQTFNEVFGATLNPYDRTRTCGGSSGGAAVALACGMTPLADGSDLGGSLRNPASFCNVVGLRTAPGRVPGFPKLAGSSSLSVEGPMARNVKDAALLLSVLAGPDSRVPASIDEPGAVFRKPLDRDFKDTRIAWSQNLGRYPVEDTVSETCDRARSTLQELGCLIEECEPDFSDADEIFQVLRAWSYAQTRGQDLKTHRNLIKDTVIWNIEQGLKLNRTQVEQAEAQRAVLIRRVRALMERYEFLVLPVSQVAPFPVEIDWVKEINGIRMETYIDWMATCYAITLTELPAISVPCGFTSGGLPVGLQIVGRPQSESGVLQLAFAFEQATGYAKTRPSVTD